MTRGPDLGVANNVFAAGVRERADVFTAPTPSGALAAARDDVFPSAPPRTDVAARREPAPARPTTPRPHRSGPTHGVLVLSFLVTALVVVGILAGLRGWTYYRTPLRVRGYAPAHKLLRPSGQVGLALGVTGSLLMVMMQAYSLRKRVRSLAKVGSLPRWLDFHIFCGILGPVLITFHTSFKFNGVVSVAYWSMVLVLLSGFVGRYLYVRIPKSIRGQELTVAQVEERAAELKADLVAMRLPKHLTDEVEEFEARVVPPRDHEARLGGLWFGEARIRLALRTLRKRVRHDGVGARTLHDVLALTAERALLLRRLAYLRRTKKLFELWHVFHRPLAYVMLVIVVVHVATAVYFGYAFGR